MPQTVNSANIKYKNLKKCWKAWVWDKLGQLDMKLLLTLKAPEKSQEGNKKFRK